MSTLVFSNAQPQKLATKRYKVCGQSLQLEIARTENQRRIGLMHRTEVPPGTGMIFIFEQEQPLSFWMKQVPMDIDIAYFDAQGVFLNAYTMKGTSPLVQESHLKSYPSLGKAKYAVEAQKGFFVGKTSKNCRLDLGKDP